MLLIWDGLRVEIPPGMEAGLLDRGYIGLFGSKLPNVDFRFSALERPFDPEQDGRRIQRKAGLPKEDIEQSRDSWARRLGGRLYHSSRLYLFLFDEAPIVVAGYFSEPPPSALVEQIFTSIGWFPRESWRPWSCHDIAFETPPHYTLQQAVFQPGHYRLTFAKDSERLIFDRLAPANVLLENISLIDWIGRNLNYAAGPGTEIVSRGTTELDFMKKTSLFSKVTSWFPRVGRYVRGTVRHHEAGNKILIITMQGVAPNEDAYQRIRTSYATNTTFTR